MADVDSFNELPDDVLLSMIQDPLFDENDPSWQQSAEDYMADSITLDSVNTKKGAPINIRASVNAAQSEDDRLLTLKNFFPNAVRVEDLSPEFGAERFGNGNFVYTDPETQELTLFDEQGGFLFGASIADLTADIGPEIAETVGAIGGAIGGVAVGLAAAPFTAGVVNPVTAGIAGEGLGSASARESYIGMLNYFGETEDNRTLGEVGGDFAITASLNAAAGPVLTKFAQGYRFAKNSVRYVADTMSVEAREAFKKIKSVISTPTVGQINLNPLTNSLEKILLNLPGASKTLHTAAKRTLVELQDKALDLAGKFGGARTQTEAAEQLLREPGAVPAVGPADPGGSLRQARQRYNQEVDSKYQVVDNLLPDSAIANIDSVVKLTEDFMITSNTAVGNRSAAPGLRNLEAITKDFLDGNLSFERLRKLRTQLLEDTRSPLNDGATSSSEKTEIKRVIGAITDVLDSHVGSFGDDALVGAYKEANQFVAKNMGDFGNITYLDSVLKNNSPLIETALRGIVNSTKQGPGAIKKLKEVLTPEEFSVLPGYLIGRMGLPTPGLAEGVELGVEEGAEYIAKSGWSPATFMNNWNSMSKEAKDVLFKGSEYGDLVKELDNLQFTVQRVKDAAKMSGNPSGTAQSLHSIGWLAAATSASVFGSFEMGFTAVVAPPVLAKLMTSPKFVRWMAEGTEIISTNPDAMAQHVRRLVQIQLANPELKDGIEAVLQGLQGETAEPLASNMSSSSQTAPMTPNENKFRQVSTSEVADKLLPQDQQLAQSIDNFQMPEFSGNAFGAVDPVMASSPTLLPDERDREIAMRQNQGIAGLV